ncbi:MAG: hypothetical protein M3Z46_03160 [Actinomycetota bacterium]|nr:hypothetical protein [Actinomycetota bacterium]
MAEDGNAGYWAQDRGAEAQARPLGVPPPSPPPSTQAPIRSSGGFDEARPAPRLPGVLAAAAGILVVSSSILLISQLPRDNRRLTALLLSLAFEALGLVALHLWRNRPAATAGVVVSAIGVVPALVFAFVDPNRPHRAFSSFDHTKGTLTGILGVSAALWVVAYLFGAGRRFGFYLGAALVALWLVSLLQIATSSLERLFNGSTSFSFGSGRSSDSSNSIADRSSIATSTLTRIGIVSLVVGLIYLVLARVADRRGGGRAATPFFATAPVILTVAVLTLINSWKAEGASILAMALGGLLIWLGTTSGRRFTSWFGAYAVSSGTFALIVKLARTHLTVAGLLVLAAGVALALLANWLTGRADPGDTAEPMTPLPAWNPPPDEISTP